LEGKSIFYCANDKGENKMADIKIDDQLEVEEVINTLQSSFHPLRCFAELHQNDQRIRYKIFDTNNEPIYYREDIPIYKLQNKSSLRAIIREARSAIKEKNHQLSDNGIDSV